MSSQESRTLWPGWETGAIIGRGSFGEVYEIHRDVFSTREQAALKVIKIPQHDGDIDEMYSDGYDEESITSTFKNHLESIVAEYTMMRKLSDCPNIVHCDDIRYVQHDNGIGWDIFIKMELLTPLTRALSGDISEEQAIHVAADLCAALELCGRHRIVHRDIKPQNIFLAANGDYKLGDFGIAKTVERTMGGTKIGTYKYMAPEVYNNQPYGTGADIYSLGLVLYWLLNEKRMPFLPLPPAKLTMGMEEQARNRRLSGEPLPPPAHGSEALKTIVLKACAYHPADRYASATEMRNALQALRPKAPVITEWMDETDALGDIWVQQPPVVTPPAEDLDVRQTLQFAYEDNPAGNVVNVQVGAETVQVWIPEQLENGQTLFYAGMGRKSVYTGQKGNLYLTVHVAPASMQANVNRAPKRKTTGLIAAVLAGMLLIGGVFWFLSSAGIVGGPKWKRNILMQDSYIDPDVAGSILGNTANVSDVLAYCAQHPVLGSDIPRSQIVSVTFLDTVDSAPSNSWDVSVTQDGKVLAWVIPNGDLYDLYIAGEGGVNGEMATSHMFDRYINLKEVRFNTHFHTQDATDMTSMFDNCNRLETIDINTLDTAAVTSMRWMFSGCYNIKSLDLSAFDTSSSTDMCGMFYNCSGLQSLGVGKFDTSSVSNMMWMFSGCSTLKMLDLSSFNTSLVINMELMFYGCTSLEILIIQNWDTSSVVTMRNLFSGCQNLRTLDVSGFDTSAVQDMSYMFDQCASLETLNLSNFDTSNVTNMQKMFSECLSLNTLQLGNFNTDSVIDMGGMFYKCSWLKSLDITSFNTSAVRDMMFMFALCYELETLDVSAFDTSNVSNMEGMFLSCGNLKTLDVSNFNTSSVAKMNGMFAGCYSLKKLDVSGFDTSSVVEISDMFFGCNSLESLDVRHFDLSNATSKDGFYIANGVVHYEGY